MKHVILFIQKKKKKKDFRFFLIFCFIFIVLSFLFYFIDTDLSFCFLPRTFSQESQIRDPRIIFLWHVTEQFSRLIFS